jgi:hypothetical protein
MRNSVHSTKRRLTAMLGTSALVISGAAAAAILTAGTASADDCSTATETNCTIGGSSELTAGDLTVQGAATMSLNGTLTGVNQMIAGDPDLTVVDATGSGDGWQLTASASTFTNVSDSDVLIDANYLIFDGSSGSADDTDDVPSAVCVGSNTCTSVTNHGVSYPVDLTTAPSGATALTILNAAVGSGLGSFDIGGGTNPGTFWLNVPANTKAGTYTSTITMSIASGPSGTS